MFAHVGAVVAIGFIVASAIMNYLFGYSLGRTPLEAVVYGLVGVLAVISNALCPFFASCALKSRRMPTLYAVVAFWLLCIVYSITRALGFAAENRQAIATPKASTHEILKTKLDTLQDLERRKRTVQIEMRIHAMREEINTLRARGAAADPETQISLIADIIGLDRSNARLALLILFALMVEVGAAVALFAALSTEPRKRTPPKAEQMSDKVRVWNPTHKAGAGGR